MTVKLHHVTYGNMETTKALVEWAYIQYCLKIWLSKIWFALDPTQFLNRSKKARVFQVIRTDDTLPQQCEVKQLHFWATINSINHSLYSPHLGRSDLFLFPYVKKQLRGEHFSTLEQKVAEIRMRVLGIIQSGRRKCFRGSI